MPDICQRHRNDISDCLPTDTVLRGWSLYYFPISHQVVLIKDGEDIYRWNYYYEPTLGEIYDKLKEVNA
jgi:hypothetical protein